MLPSFCPWTFLSHHYPRVLLFLCLHIYLPFLLLYLTILLLVFWMFFWHLFACPSLLLCFLELLSMHHSAMLLSVLSMLLLSNSTMAAFFLSYILDTEFSFHSFLNTPTTISLCPHWVYFTLTTSLSFAEFSLYFHASKHWLYQIFFSYFPKTKTCPWFSYILVPLYSYLLHSTNVTTFYLVFHPCSFRAIPLGGILLLLQHSCTFLYKECTDLFFYCAFCRLVVYATFSSLFFSSFQLQYLGTSIWST